MDDINILEKQADILMQNVAGWENSVIEHIGKRIGKIGGMTPADVKMLNNIADVTQDMDEVIKELAHVTGLNIAQIEEMYGNTLAEHHLENNPLYDFRGKVFVPFAENKELQSLVRAYAKTTAGTMLNLSKTKGLCILNEYGRPIALKKYYNDILDKAVMQVASGATDFHTAMRQSITALGGSGLRVDYGGGITRRLDTVVRQTVLWGAKQAFNEYSDMIGEELGCDGIEIDYHRNPRPSHEFMQGKQYVLGKARKINGVYFESADEALERLEDYNCYHFKTPIICGISEPAYDEQELKRMREEDAKEYTLDGKSQNGYGWSQDMRKLETYMREQKRIKVAAKASGDSLLVRKCNERIKAAQAKYEQISEATGIRQDPSRFTIPRQPRSVKDVLTSYNQSGIIKASETPEYMRAQFPKGFVDETCPGELISIEKLNRFYQLAKEQGIKFDESLGKYGGFDKYRGDFSVLEDAITSISYNKKEMSRILKNKNVLLRYDDVKSYDGAIDVNAFAMVKSRTITLNRFMYDDTDFLKKQYQKSVEDGIFTPDTDYKNVIDHEMGHILNNFDNRIVKRMRRIIEKEAEIANMSFNNFVESKISIQAVWGDEIIAEINAMRNGKTTDFAKKIWKEAFLE